MKNHIDCDVFVCGGGVAGVAAAIAAARQGKKTILVEKQCILGGLATSGLIYIYLALSDNDGNQVTFGIAEEMIRRCTAYGPFDVSEKWGGPAGGNPGTDDRRFQCCFAPAAFALVLDEMLREAGVDLWIDSVVTDAKVDGEKITSVNVYNSSGNTRIFAKAFVDASGGAYLVRLAGGKVFPGSNRLTPWVLEMAEDPGFYHFTGDLHIEPFWRGSEMAGQVYEDCRSGKAVTGFVRDSWELLRGEYARRDKKKNYPVQLPGMPQLRTVAYIDAMQILNDDDAWKTVPDSVGKVSYWRDAASLWDTPFGALKPKKFKNVLAAGRCIGACGEAWEVYRVIPAAALTGEVAGCASALAVGLNVEPCDLDCKVLQNKLGF